MFKISTMANLETEFHELLTRSGAKHEEEMSICSSTPLSLQGEVTSK